MIVRTLLVPALVAIMDEWNWWMPRGLSRLLRVSPSAGPRPGASIGERIAAAADRR